MRRPLPILCLALCVLLFSVREGWSTDFKKGFDAAKQGEYATAIHEWKILAERGDTTAQFNLGWLYANGKGVPQDHITAAKWYMLAAAQGYVPAQYNLGVMYKFGMGVS